MKIFVTGTDTDAGKTVACAWLCLHSGADYWKPIQSGYPPDRDADTVSRLSGAAVHPERHMLRAPLSPLHAGRLENLCIDIDDFRTPSTTRPLVIEGAGGVLVPVNERAPCSTSLRGLARRSLWLRAAGWAQSTTPA
jgi:dethiobiotin synthetase/malonyl-CoA O-methyltransferase